ncbi:hypothetical protein [Mesorhizobium sp.]|uniref:hypothetical protein n=1 Tax=Mesorhizobium sp. TaxID=1871066 RepID=UPI000FEA6EE2|nr:hypothetical protein [Mesorhizobium sp.]RWB25442.1 MAG: hypothetical protein EOQ43_33345 [Mesorhizobium sp.]
MIRYADATLANVCALVDAEKPAWRTDAETRTAAIVAAGAFSKGAPSWSDIKAIFMRLQSNKCAFCEFPLGGEFAGKATQDVEHFRPKNEVKAWPNKAKKPSYTFNTGGTGSGYYWLAYDLSNYAAACKACNTARKSNYFPIAGARGAAPNTAAELNAVEQPYLVFPLGEADEDPESLITFAGLVALPAHDADGHAHCRGRVTIDFFALNQREELWEDRFRTIYALFDAVEITKTNANPNRVEIARRRIEDMTSIAGAQAACARSFLRLLEADPQKAWDYYVAAEEFITDNRKKRAPKLG